MNTPSHLASPPDAAEHEQLQCFGYLLDTLPAAAYMCDAAGLITYFNQQAVEVWGRAPRLNDPVDRYCGSFKLFSVDGGALTHDACWMARALQTEEKYNGQEIIVERPDGRRITALAHANPIFNGSGKLIGAVNILVDITEQKRGEEAQRLLAAIVESSEDAIISKTLDGHILSWNRGAQRLFGYTVEEAIGQPITLIIPSERQSEEETILARLQRGERIEQYETVRVKKDGRRIDVSLTVSPVRDSRGQIVGASKVVRDITLQKRAEDALRQADRRKDEFLATLAHELRNPLAPLANALHLLRLADDLSPTAHHVRDIMERQVNHMVRLVEDLLEVSRITRGKIAVKKAPVELAAVVASAVETSRPVIDSAGQQLAITIAPEPMILYADAVRLSQVIANLLNNSAKYGKKGGQIWLTARRDGNQALVSVCDDGIGIPAEMLARVFDMFAQVEQTRNRAQGGLGIGLTIAHRLVQLHDGHIEARSDGLGTGSEFIVRLPLMAQDTGSDPSPGSLASATVGNGRAFPTRRVLVVDDTQASAFILGKLLETMGQNVTTAHDGASALERARATSPDVVISDIAMPDMDGYELARRLRHEPGMERAVLVALTGYGQESDRQQAKEAGFDYHLVKPVSLEALEEVLAFRGEAPVKQESSAAKRIG